MRFLAAACALALGFHVFESERSRSVTWEDLSPLHARLAAHGITSATFTSYRDRIRADNLRRVRDGDLDHLIFYALQSTHFTKRPPIEPALSAKAFVEGGNRVPDDARARIRDLLKAVLPVSGDPRLAYFRTLVRTTFPKESERERAVVGEYTRAMRFLYDKEFVARRAGGDAVVELYRRRGLSTDTAVEAGYVIYTGLGILKALDSTRRIRRVLIVGPGLDLAPRTSMLEAGPPQSYQPWAVMDALVSLRLSRLDDLAVVGADINPRVVDHLRASAAAPPTLTLVSGIADSATVHTAGEYRSYFARLGGAIGTVDKAPGVELPGHLLKTVRISPAAARILSADPLDVVTARLETAPFDLVIATNILPYFDDTELMLAVSNIAAMLAPGGVFMHNEPRPVLGEITTAVGMPFEQSRSVTIASVDGAPAPLADSVWLHRKTQ